MYVLKEWIKTNPDVFDMMLLEMSAHEFNKLVPSERFSFRRVTANYAHKYVKDGKIHCTALYVDDYGKVRRASEGV